MRLNPKKHKEARRERSTQGFPIFPTPKQEGRLSGAKWLNWATRWTYVKPTKAVKIKK